MRTMKNYIDFRVLFLILLINGLISSCRKYDLEGLSKTNRIENVPPNISRAAIVNSYYDVDSIGHNIQIVSESPRADSERSRLTQSFIPSDFYPTGFLLAPLDTLKIKAEVIVGTSLPQLLIGTYQRYENVSPQSIQLQSGENVIVANKNGGIIWIRYSSLMPSNKTRLTFISGHKAVPVFIKNTTTLSQWQNLFEQADTAVHDVLLIGQRVNIVLPRTYTALKNQNNNSVLNACDKVWDTMDELSGLDGTLPLHKRLGTSHLLVNRVYAGGAAWPYVTTYSYQASFSESYANDAWYQRHEAGHHHQQRWDWHAEIMADFYAVSVGMNWGLSRKTIARDGGWVQVWKRVKEYFDLPDSSRNYAKIWDPSIPNFISSGARFRASAMLIQLKLAFGDTFYHELHKQTRLEKPSLQGAASKYRYFMLKACSISGKNLTRFFFKWGFKDEEAYQQIAALNLPLPDVDPSTLTDDPTFTLK
ncbi:MAG TPA: M60 family metallopeptidase [Chitinophaga sp.]|uniref:M60 family metallopeptidase n=1 Tax=Chitinophaga sp. TaxID=1869181 RepID=UPI002B778962|nr:M60 family metallopeptidase [Chitinophaga sp.]HVI46144.1 M60 family metallopeptidase [Chitinophaga sp.]